MAASYTYYKNTTFNEATLTVENGNFVTVSTTYNQLTHESSGADAARVFTTIVSSITSPNIGKYPLELDSVLNYIRYTTTSRGSNTVYLSMQSYSLSVLEGTAASTTISQTSSKSTSLSIDETTVPITSTLGSTYVVNPITTVSTSGYNKTVDRISTTSYNALLATTSGTRTSLIENTLITSKSTVIDSSIDSVSISENVITFTRTGSSTTLSLRTSYNSLNSVWTSSLSTSSTYSYAGIATSTYSTDWNLTSNVGVLTSFTSSTTSTATAVAIGSDNIPYIYLRSLEIYNGSYSVATSVSLSTSQFLSSVFTAYYIGSLTQEASSTDTDFNSYSSFYTFNASNLLLETSSTSIPGAVILDSTSRIQYVDYNIDYITDVLESANATLTIGEESFYTISNVDTYTTREYSSYTTSALASLTSSITRQDIRSSGGLTVTGYTSNYSSLTYSLFSDSASTWNDNVYRSSTTSGTTTYSAVTSITNYSFGTYTSSTWEDDWETVTETDFTAYETTYFGTLINEATILNTWNDYVQISTASTNTVERNYSTYTSSNYYRREGSFSVYNGIAKSATFSIFTAGVSTSSGSTITSTFLSKDTTVEVTRTSRTDSTSSITSSSNEGLVDKFTTRFSSTEYGLTTSYTSADYTRSLTNKGIISSTTLSSYSENIITSVGSTGRITSIISTSSGVRDVIINMQSSVITVLHSSSWWDSVFYVRADGTNTVSYDAYTTLLSTVIPYYDYTWNISTTESESVLSKSSSASYRVISERTVLSYNITTNKFSTFNTSVSSYMTWSSTGSGLLSTSSESTSDVTSTTLLTSTVDFTTVSSTISSSLSTSVSGRFISSSSFMISSTYEQQNETLMFKTSWNKYSYYYNTSYYSTIDTIQLTISASTYESLYVPASFTTTSGYTSRSSTTGSYSSSTLVTSVSSYTTTWMPVYTTVDGIYITTE